MKERILREAMKKREQCVKHFQLAQKGMAAAVYPFPVHFEKDGQWEEIDNRLEAVVKNGKEIYRNRASAVEVSFAGKANQGNLVTVKKNGKQIAWKLEIPGKEAGTQNVDGINVAVNEMEETEDAREVQSTESSFRVLEKSEFWENPEKMEEAGAVEKAEADAVNRDEVQCQEEQMNVSENVKSEDLEIPEKSSSGNLDEEDIRKKMAVPNLFSEGMYADILPGVDLHYAVQSEQIKENIRLNTKEAANQPLTFTFTHPGMTIQKEEDGSIGLYAIEKQEENAGETKMPERIFRLAAPYMYDKAGNRSFAVELKAEEVNGGSRITVVADKEWLFAEDRIYPVVIDPMTETSKTKGNIEDTYIFSGGTGTEDPSKVYAYGSFPVGKSTEAGKIRALLRFRNLPDIGKGSIIYAATMYIWQYQYSSFGTETIPLMAHEVKNIWDEKSVRWSNQPAFDSIVLDYKKVGQVKNGSTITITPIGFDVTRLVRQWYNTGNNYGILVRSQYEDSTITAQKAYARFYASDSPSISSAQFPSGVFYYRNVNGLEDYQSYHEQPAGRAGTGYTNDFTGNVVWIHPDAQTTGGPMPAAIRHVYNSSEAGTPSRLGYGWRLSSQQQLISSGITDYPYIYIDEDGTKHYFYKDTADGNKLKDEDGLGLTITQTTGTDYDHYLVIEAKDKTKYTFGKDGYLRFIEAPDGNKITHQYGANATANYLSTITDPTGGRMVVHYTSDAVLSNVTYIEDMAGRQTHFKYDAQGNLISIIYPDGKITQFTYDSAHKLLSVTNLEGYGVKYQYTSDFRVPRVSRITEIGSGKAGQELKITYENGNTTIFEEPGLDGELGQTGDNKKTTWHFDNMGRPTDVIDSDGFANNYSYYADGMKNHKLSKDGSTQKTVYGLLRNHLFDPARGDDGWYNYRLADGRKSALVIASGYSGSKSAKLVKTDAASEEGVCQDVRLKAGTYTLSAYVKTEGMSSKTADGKGAGLAILKAGKKWTLGERFIDYNTDAKVDAGWERLTVTFQLTAEETVTVFAGILGMKGTLYVSGAQLEAGAVANKLNLVMNSGFEMNVNGAPDYWEYSTNTTGVKSVVTSDRGRCVALNGEIDKALFCAHAVNVTGKEGDVFNLSCWVKGFGIPEKNSTVAAAVLYTDGSVKWHHFKCNPNIKGWQFVSNTFRTDDDNNGADKEYRAIHVYLNHDNQANQILYDGIQLIKDDGESYQYDDQGNLISSESAAEKSHFVCDKKGSLTRLGSIDGTAFNYGYDAKNHLVKAANSEGVRYAFDYNAKGQPTKMKVEGGKHLGAVTTGRTYYIREKYSGNYLDVRNGQAADGTVIQLYTFGEGPSQQWKVIDCKDGYVSFAPERAPEHRLHLAGNSSSEGAAIQIYKSNNTDAQKWKLHPKTDGSYQISCKGTKDKNGLTNAPKSVTAGQAVQSYILADDKVNQDWYFEPADEGNISAVPASGKIVSIRVRHSGQYIDVDGNKTTAGTRAMQNFGNGGASQQYRMTSTDGVYYQLEPLHASGMVLARSGKNASGYDRLALEAKVSGAANQLFRFEEAQPGKGNGYGILCKENAASLDVMNYSHGATADIILTGHAVPDQVNKWWILEECSERMESSMTYTSDGRNIASVTDARGNTIRYEYDAKNRLPVKALDAKGNATSYTYDANTDKLTSVKKTVGGKEVKVSYAYTNDQLKSITHNGFAYNYGYDIYGNLQTVSVGSKELERTVYRNKNGLVDRITYATGESIRNVYDKEERLVSQYLVKANGTEEKLFTNTYDNYGNVLKHVNHRNGISSSYQYDLIGRILGADTTDGLRLRNAYDEKNRVKSVTQKLGSAVQTAEYLYGDVTKQQKPGLFYGLKIDGTERVTYAYDQLARLRVKALKLDGGKVYNTIYDCLPGAKAGTTTALVSSIQNGSNKLSYTYDKLGNIEKISENGTLKCTYHYDELNRLVREDNVWENKTICYAYDIGGNMTSWKEYGYTNPANAVPATVVKQNTYTYGNTVWKDQMTAYNGQAITYDGMGNPLSYRGMTMTWEKGRQLKQVVKGGKTTTYAYDNNGVRISKTVDGVKTSYYLSGDRIVALKKGSEVIQFAYDEKGNPVSMLAGGKRYYYLYNAQGDVIGLLDSAGAQVVTYRYNSWGKPLSVSDSTAEKIGSKNPFRYRGYCLDEETGLYYVTSRYYDAEIGRFVNADDVGVLNVEQGSAQQYNLYAYCLDNPVNRVDVGGNFSVISILVGAGIGAIDAAINKENVLVGALIGGLSGVLGGCVVQKLSGCIVKKLGKKAVKKIGGEIVVDVISGAFVGGASDWLEQRFDGKKFNGYSMMVSIASGAAGAGIGRAFDDLAEGDSAEEIIKSVGSYFSDLFTGVVFDFGLKNAAGARPISKKKSSSKSKRKITNTKKMPTVGYYNRYGGPTRVICLE